MISRGRARRENRSSAHLPRPRVEELRRRGVRVLAARRAAQGVVAQVRDHQQAARAGRKALVHVDAELEERVELQELDARPVEDLLPRHLAQHALHGAVGAVVPVAHRVLEKPAARVEEAVVHGPGVDPDRLDRPAAPRRRALPRGETLLQAVEDRAERPAQPARRRRRRVVEPVDLLESDATRAQPAEHGPPAARPEVDRQVTGAVQVTIQDLTPPARRCRRLFRRRRGALPPCAAGSRSPGTRRGGRSPRPRGGAPWRGSAPRPR